MFTLELLFPAMDAAAAIAGGRTSSPTSTTPRANLASTGISASAKSARGGWSSEEARWTLEVESGPERRRPIDLRLPASSAPATTATTPATAQTFPASTLLRPHRPSADWTDDIDYVGKRVLVIGSGATAVTLVPALAGAPPMSPCCSGRRPTLSSAPSRTSSPTRCAVLCLTARASGARWTQHPRRRRIFRFCRRIPCAMAAAGAGARRAGAGLRRRDPFHAAL